MVGGFERYYQIARCFRDEDQRADRQPDFTQLDIEMSFVEVEDVLAVNERLLAHVLERVGGPKLELPLPRMPYDEAMARFGQDSPDLRFGLELRDLSSALAGHRVQGVRGSDLLRWRRQGPQRRQARDSALGPRRTDRTRAGAWREGPRLGLPRGRRLALADREVPLRRGTGGAQRRRSRRRRATYSSIVADTEPTANAVLGQLRLDMAERFDLIDPDSHSFCWIVDWPLFGWNEEAKRWDPLHHPFTAPDGELDPAEPGAARARPTTSSGTARSSAAARSVSRTRPCRSEAFEAIGISDEEAEARFGFLLEALRYGAPPHGGIAYGLDRFVQRVLDAGSIRDVIAFPKAASGADPLTGAPAPVDPTQLGELGLQVRPGKK